MRFLGIFLLIVLGFSASAQVVGFRRNDYILDFRIHTVGYQGDLNPRNFTTLNTSAGARIELKSNPLYFIFKKNSRTIKIGKKKIALPKYFNDKFLVTYALDYSHMYFSDFDINRLKNLRRYCYITNALRNLSFKTDVVEFGMNLQWIPWRFGNGIGMMRTDPRDFYIEPILSLGFNAMWYNPRTDIVINGQQQTINLRKYETEGFRYSPISASFVTGIGVRFIPKSKKYAVGFNFDFHYTFTDYLDDVSRYVPTKFSSPEQALLSIRSMENNPTIKNSGNNLSVIQNNEQLYRKYYGLNRGDMNDRDAFYTFGVTYSYFLKGKKKKHR